MVKIIVMDKSTRKVVWIEEHPTATAAEQAIKELKERNFNPDYFDFSRQI